MTQAKHIDIDAVSAGPELDALVAVHVMGWELMPPIPQPDDGCADIYYRDGDWSLVALEDMSAFSTDANCVREVEAEIRQQGLAGKYVACLVRKVDPNNRSVYTPESELDLFPLIHATPEQRCRAAYKAVMGEGIHA